MSPAYSFSSTNDSNEEKNICHTHPAQPSRSVHTFGTVSHGLHGGGYVAFFVEAPACVSFLSLNRLENAMVEFHESANGWVQQTNDDNHVGTSITVVCAWTGIMDAM